jgi:hypothetical protein
LFAVLRSFEEKRTRIESRFVHDSEEPVSVLPIYPQQTASVCAIPPVRDLSDQVPLVFHAPGKLARIRECEALGVEAFEFQSDLLIDHPKCRDHI